MPNIVVPPLIETLLASEEPAQLRTALGLARAPRNSDEAASQIGKTLIESLSSLRSYSNAIIYFATKSPIAKSFQLKTTTGYARIINPDSTFGPVVGTGVPSSLFELTFGSGGGTHRAYGIASVSVSGSITGEFTTLIMLGVHMTAIQDQLPPALDRLILRSNYLTTFSMLGLEFLTTLDLADNKLLDFYSTSQDYTLQVTTLDLYFNQLTSFTSSDFPNANYIKLADNQLTSFSGPDLGQLTHLDLTNNQITSFSGLGMSSLNQLFISQNRLTAFSAEGMPNLNSVVISSNFLSSVDMNGRILNFDYYPHAGSDFSNNNLDANALNALYTSLGSNVGGTTGVIDVFNNPGTTGDNPSIADLKNYFIVGT